MQKHKQVQSHQVEEMIPGVELLLPRNGRAVDDSFMEKIIAMRPTYAKEYGNCSHILLTDGQLYWGHTVAQTVNDVNRYWLHNHEEMRYLYKRFTSQSQCPPLIHHSTGDPLAAMKMRHPSGRNDGAMGYVRTTYIKYPLEPLYLPSGELGTRIHLTTGQSVDVLWSERRVQQQINHAENLANRLALMNRLGASPSLMTYTTGELFNAIIRLINEFCAVRGK